METQQDPTQHFFLSMEMMQIGFGKIFAGITAAIFSQRSKIMGIFRLRDLNVSLVTKRLTMPTQSCRQHTVKHIKSSLYRMTNIFWSSNSHQISWLVSREFRTDELDNITHEMFAFPDTDASDSDPIPSILRKDINRLLPQI
jgi:hypothetical protein